MSLFHEPRFSPDWAYIAYLHAAGDNQFDLQISTLNGEPITYAPSVQEFNGWSPDSERFIFATDFTTRELGSINQAPRPLLDSNTAVTDVYWVDAERFIYLNQTPSGWNIVLGNINGANHILDAIAGFPPAYDFKN